MPTTVNEVNVLREYLQGVMDRADHHANKVNEVVLALVGAIVWKKDEEPFKVMGTTGDMKNVLWAKINGTKYAFSYNHEHGTIDMREGSTQGQTIKQFSNKTTASDIREFFLTLR